MKLHITTRRRRVRRMPQSTTPLSSLMFHERLQTGGAGAARAVSSTAAPAAPPAAPPAAHSPALTKPHPTNGSKRPHPIVIYPTGILNKHAKGRLKEITPSDKSTFVRYFYVFLFVSPESIVVPIVSCIFGFPLLALTVICCLRRRAKLARERARRRNCELDRGELSVVRVSPVKRTRAVSLVRSPRPLPALELDTVLEEKSDPEQTQVEMMTPDREVSAILFPHGGGGERDAAAAAAGEHGS